MFDVGLAVAFFAGVASFFAPCVIPLLPAYVGYVTGVSLNELKEKGYAPFRKKLIFSSLFYILGFSIIFVLLGTAAASVGASLRRYDDVIRIVGGLIIFVLGLQFAGILKLPFLVRQHQIQLPDWTKNLGHTRAFIIGIVFATAWTPCVGAVLGSILALAAVSGTALQGALLLFVYSLGISVPFMIVSLTLVSAPKYLSFVNRHVEGFSKVAGILLAILGLLLITNSYRYLNAWLFEIAFQFGYQIK